MLTVTLRSLRRIYTIIPLSKISGAVEQNRNIKTTAPFFVDFNTLDSDPREPFTANWRFSKTNEVKGHAGSLTSA